MNSMSHRIDYIEFPATDLTAIKVFYQDVFGWVFTDYGPGYTSFADGRIAGGFTKETHVRPLGPLIVIYAEDLAAVQEKIKAACGNIVKPTFEFPGGKRFHFTDPSGNELSVWSDK